MYRSIIGLAALATFAAMPAAASTTITNVPAWDGSTDIFYFGAPDTANYGQTFLSPGGNLNSVTFQLLEGNAGNFKLVVADWNGNALTGAPLYESAPLYFDGSAGAYSFSPNLATTPGGNYIAFMTVAGVANPASTVRVGGTFGDTITSGAFRYLNTSGAAPTVGANWDTYFVQDMAFTAVFDAVPEPATWAMMIAGFGMVGFAARRRRLIAA